MAKEGRIRQMILSGWDLREINELFSSSRRIEKDLVKRFKNDKKTMRDFM